jgi:hypothetical protein
VRLEGAGPIVQGSDVFVGEAVIGRVGSVDGIHALAMLRLDRALEARDKGQPLAAAGTPLSVDAAALAAYAAAETARKASAS